MRLALDDIVNDTLALYENPAESEHRDDLGGAPFVAHGWYSATRDWAQGALLMERAGLSGSAAPLRRSMIEHALALFWLASAPEDVLDSLRMAQQRDVRKLEEAMAGGEWSVPPELVEQLLALPAAGSHENVSLHVKHRAERLGQRNLLVAWLHETAASHASLSSASRYVCTWPGEKTRNGASSDAPASGMAQIALHLLLATDAFNAFLVDGPWSKPLADLEQRFTDALQANPSKAR
jgi:hypothetical protein